MRRTTKSIAALLIVASSCVAISGSAFAFNDIKNDPGAAHILDLKKRGIIQGVGNDLFKPGAKVNGATAVTLIVKGLKLNIDDIRFFKKPEASDFFTKIKNDAPYAGEFIIAQLNGLDIPRDLDPSKNVTREQFAHWLFKGILAKGDFAFTEQFIQYTDADAAAPAYSDSIQKLLISGVADLDKKGAFRPQDVITRSEAAVLVDKAIEFVEKTPPILEVPDNPESTILTDVKLASVAFADGVSKVTVSATAPHPGYGIEISSISFSGGQATINYRVVMPDPAALYPQVIADVHADAYIPSSYKAVLGKVEPSLPAKTEGDASSSSSSGAAAGGSTGFPINE